MTQDGYAGGGAEVAAAADRISATLDSMAHALLGAEVSRQPHTALRARSDEASAAGTGPLDKASAIGAGPLDEASAPSTGPLFEQWLSPAGPGRLAVRGLGTLVEGGSVPAPGAEAASAAGTVRRLLARYGEGPVRGVDGLYRPLDAAAFQLPVSAEPSAARLRPEFTAPLAELADGRQTLTAAELPTGSGVRVRLAVPPAFHALTARGGERALAEQLGEVADELFAGCGTATRRDWAVVAATLAEETEAADVLYAGVAALRIEGRPSNASLVVALGQSPRPITELAAQLADARPQAEVWTVIVPSGPAAVLVQGRTAAVPAALAPDGLRRWVVSSVVQAFLPLPDGLSVLTVQLGTAHGEDWALYTEVFADLLRSVEIGWDGEGAPGPVPLAAPAPAPAAELPPRPVAPPPAAPATPAQGTPLRPLPADFNPFAPAETRTEPRTETRAETRTEPRTETRTQPPATTAAEQAPVPGSTPYPLLPPDFNPFAPQSS